MPYEAALTRLALARQLGRVGDRDAARQAAELARATFARLGADPALAATIALLGDLATLPSQPGPPMPEDLTAREGDVLRLVSEGLANRTIAARLSVSPRTVSTHLGAVDEYW